jgi:hypothetical protein
MSLSSSLFFPPPPLAPALAFLPPLPSSSPPNTLGGRLSPPPSAAPVAVEVGGLSAVVMTILVSSSRFSSELVASGTLRGGEVGQQGHDGQRTRTDTLLCKHT